MKLAIAAAICAAIMCGPCFAQTQPAATDTVRANHVDPARLAAARRVVRANGSETSIGVVIDRLVPDIMHSIASGHELNAAQEQHAVELVQTEMHNAIQEMVELTAIAYAQNMTAEDLTTLAEFYESAAGQRYIATLPQIMNDSMTASQVFAEQVLVPRMTARVAQMEQQGLLTP